MHSNALSPHTIIEGVSYAYEILKVLGQGSFGITYLATVRMQGALGSLDTNIKVAIKEFFMRDVNGRKGDSVTCNGDTSLFDNYRRDFVKEALNLSRMSHPHIIRVLESFDCNGTSYYAMEFIDGTNLNEYIVKSRGLSEYESLECVSSIAEAVSYMHQNRMLHLDIKPLNVMRGYDGKLTLIDFGLSKRFNKAGEPESSTHIGGGAMGYAPLEQSCYRRGDGFPATMDVYALGATLYKCLTSETPPDASYVLNRGLPVGDLRQCGATENTINLIERSMAPIVQNRTPTVDAFLAEVKMAMSRIGHVTVQSFAIALDADKCTVVVRDNEEVGSVRILTEIPTIVAGINPVTLLASAKSEEPEMLYDTMRTLLQRAWDVVHAMVDVADETLLLSVPSYFRLSHIRYMQQLCESMRLPLKRIMSQNDAVALGYGYCHADFEGNVAVVNKDSYCSTLSFAEIGEGVVEMMTTRSYMGTEWKDECVLSVAQECFRGLYAHEVIGTILNGSASQLQVDGFHGTMFDMSSPYAVNYGLLGLIVQKLIFEHDVNLVLFGSLRESLRVEFANAVLDLTDNDNSFPFKRTKSCQLAGLDKGCSKISIVTSQGHSHQEQDVPLFQFDLDISELKAENGVYPIEISTETDANWKLSIWVKSTLSEKEQCYEYSVPFRTRPVSKDMLPIFVDDEGASNDERTVVREDVWPKESSHSEGMEECSGFQVRWNPEVNDFQKDKIRSLLGHMKESGTKDTFFTSEYGPGMAGKKTVMALYEGSCHYLRSLTTNDDITVPNIEQQGLTIKNSLDLIYKLTLWTGLPFRLAAADEIRHSASLPPTSWRKLQTLCYSPDCGLQYQTYRESGIVESSSSVDFYSSDISKGFDLQLMCDGVKPEFDEHFFDVPVTQSGFDEIQPIGFGFYKVRQGMTWNISSPCSPMAFCLPDNYPCVSPIGILLIPGCRFGSLGIIAQKDGCTYYFELVRNTFKLIRKKLGSEEITG